MVIDYQCASITHLVEGCYERAVFTGSAFTLSTYAAFLTCCLGRVAWTAARSPQRLIPEDLLIASMWNAVVHHVSRCDASFLLAVPAQRELSKVTQPRLLPAISVPTLRCGQPFTPCVRVKHLHGLGTDLARSGWLHGDA